jgi:hypothetical protein
MDCSARAFGMRSFRMDEQNTPRGRMYLNGEEIRLRGANTMGHEQQCVIKGDIDQLIDDILLARLCNMNFLRLTQRPVQSEVYDICDQLGMMTQTDLPLFGVLRRNQFAEAVRQAGEMEQLVRAHPCNIMVSYINEPMPVVAQKTPRHLTRTELEGFFSAATELVHVMNPDRVVKPVDGDYDPPAEGLPDNHCYCGWYNGHGLDLGKLNKGYWQKVKPGWMYGCGEFGAEGLDPIDLMRRTYPRDWLPQSDAEERNWTPSRIPKAQTGNMHGMWFETQHTLKDWVTASQAHQAWTVKLMTEAFRRDTRMNSIAIHLFIDAFPSGWMKTIMDVDRRPKPAYFTYRRALAPLMCCWRSDRFAFHGGETAALEAWVCNDLNQDGSQLRLKYEFVVGDTLVAAGEAPVEVPACTSRCQGRVKAELPEVTDRQAGQARIALVDRRGRTVHANTLDFDVFPAPAALSIRSARVVGTRKGLAATLLRELGVRSRFSGTLEGEPLIVVDGDAAAERAAALTAAAKAGARVIMLELPEGSYRFGGHTVKVAPQGFNPVHFANRNTGHPWVEGLRPLDFRFWYDATKDRVTPLLSTALQSPGWNVVLSTCLSRWRQSVEPAEAVIERPLGKGQLAIAQLHLAGRIQGNPVARNFANRILET